VGVQVQLPVVDAQRPAAEVDVVLAGQLEAELPAQRVRRRVGDAWKGVDTLEPGLAPSALDEQLERPRRDAAPLERREDHPTDLMDRAAVPLGVPDPDRARGWTSNLGHDLEPPVVLLRAAAVDIGEV